MCQSQNVVGLDGLAACEELSVQGCGIASLDNFPNLQALRKLLLADNRIGGGLENLAKLTNLEELSIGGNKIASLDELKPLEGLKLTAIDLELKRIGWGRDQERIFLERAFGHAGRHRLTRYADLVAYLRQLRQFQPGDQPEQAMVPIRRGDLISQGDQMLRDLGWSGEKARHFLDQHLKAKSRQQLSDEQLLQFNMLLEEQTIKAR